jgi:hypothetical protein
LLLLTAAACSESKSANPLSPTIAGPIAGVSIDAPKPMAPTSAAQVSTDQQPVTLIVENAATNGIRPVSYVFEISADSGFGTPLFSQSGIQQGDNGHTSLRLPQSLTPERTYYWRAKADDGANASGYSSVVSFHVFTPVMIQAPVLQSPSDNATVTSVTPALTVTNSQRTGPAGTIQYLFEVATDAAFTKKTVSTLVNEGSNQTTYTVPTDLANATRYYWHVRATDGPHSSAFSTTLSFTTPAATVVTVVVTGDDAINAAAATFLNNPTDVGSFSATARMTSVDFNGDTFTFDFDKRTGPDRWPQVALGDDGSLQYTLGMCFNLGGKWYCSAAIQYWDGRDNRCSANIARDWYYDPVRWGPMAGHQPAQGEQVAIFVVHGNLRGVADTIRERSNFILMPFGGQYRAK